MTRLELLQLRDFISGRLMCAPDESDRACFNRSRAEMIAKLDAAIIASAPEARSPNNPEAPTQDDNDA